MRIRLADGYIVWVTILFVAGLGWIDSITGYDLNFFVFYFMPVAWCTWRLGEGWGALLSLFSAVTWLAAEIIAGHRYSTNLYLVWNTTIRLASFLSIAAAVARVRRLLEVERTATDALQRALSEIKVLASFLPICAQCKKIGGKDGTWVPLEVYIGQNTNTQLSHGYCPDCLKKALAEATEAGPVPSGGDGG